MIVQARLGSSRLPGKVLKRIGDSELLGHLIGRLRHAGLLEAMPMVIATTDLPRDDVLEAFAERMGVGVYRGDAEDVTKRMLDAADRHGFERFVRLQGDDPLVDPIGIGRLVACHLAGKADITTGAHRAGWAVGTAAMVFDRDALRRGYDIVAAQTPELLARGFIPLSERMFEVAKVSPDDRTNREEIYLTVDYPEDFAVVQAVLQHFRQVGRGYAFSYGELLDYVERSGLFERNRFLHQPFDS